MAEQFVAKATEMKDGDRRIVFMGEHEVGVFKEKGEYYAYSNFCLHQGGPACEGLTIAKVEERIMPDKTSRGLYFSETELHFVCPWHGYEFDISTGRAVRMDHAAAPKASGDEMSSYLRSCAGHGANLVFNASARGDAFEKVHGLLKQDISGLAKHPMAELPGRDLAQWHIIDAAYKVRPTETPFRDRLAQSAESRVKYKVLIDP